MAHKAVTRPETPQEEGASTASDVKALHRNHQDELAYSVLREDYDAFRKAHNAKQVGQYVAELSRDMAADKDLPSLAIAWGLAQAGDQPADAKLTPQVLDQAAQSSDPIDSLMARTLKSSLTRPDQPVSFSDLDRSLDSDPDEKLQRTRDLANGLAAGWRTTTASRESVFDAVAKFNHKDPENYSGTYLGYDDFDKVRRALQDKTTTPEKLGLNRDQIALINTALRQWNSTEHIADLSTSMDGQLIMSKATIDRFREKHPQYPQQ
jgi:hypothetical protein